MKDFSEQVQEIVTDALKFWEKSRLLYNGVLMVLVAGFWIVSIFTGTSPSFVNTVFALFFLAIIANLLYCTAYIADVFVQFSAYQTLWHKYRWILLAFGTFLAVLLASSLCYAMFFCRVCGK
ncbi:hypothetical protein U27_02497 [Candidatus Vecturithrix granuli]|uniref:Uncharacterized protein n=1 Tax=Vecturithrix granuli TaxID=1499967 RepID=A0A0S6WAS1_VECG1|nr:hypothetical protein U27_02497 [Candidatus Vecturithrix granuli]